MLENFPAPLYNDNWFMTYWDFGPTWLCAFIIIMAFGYGSCVGSFLNVCIWRIPRGESVVFAPSHCPRCNNLLKWYDNLPIWGYLNLRGRCRFCHEPIAIRYLLMEILVGAIFVAILLKVGISRESWTVFLRFIPMAMLIVTTYFIDRRYRIIPDMTTYPAMIFGIVISIFMPKIWGLDNVMHSFLYALFSCLIFGGALGVFAILGRLISKQDVLGWGDIKYMMAAGALLGVPGAFFTLLIGAFCAMIYGIIRAYRKGRKISKTSIALGPFLAMASLLWILILG